MARIVVAEDNEVTRNGIKATLNGDPHLNVCGFAENGEEAIDRVLELMPDLVILDLNLPVHGGFQAASKIRQLAPSVKILIFSTHDAPLVEQLAHLMGAHAYLRKSAAGPELISTIKSALDGNPTPLASSAGQCSSSS